jgi:hypothetical protein
MSQGLPVRLRRKMLKGFQYIQEGMETNVQESRRTLYYKKCWKQRTWGVYRMVMMGSSTVSAFSIFKRPLRASSASPTLSGQLSQNIPCTKISTVLWIVCAWPPFSTAAKSTTLSSVASNPMSSMLPTISFLCCAPSKSIVALLERRLMTTLRTQSFPSSSFVMAPAQAAQVIPPTATDARHVSATLESTTTRGSARGSDMALAGGTVVGVKMFEEEA